MFQLLETEPTLPPSCGWVACQAVWVGSDLLNHGARSHLVCSTWVPTIYSHKTEARAGEWAGILHSELRRVGREPAESCQKGHQMWWSGTSSVVFKQTKLLIRSLDLCLCLIQELYFSVHLPFVLYPNFSSSCCQGHITAFCIYIIYIGLFQVCAGHPWNTWELSYHSWGVSECLTHTLFP